jgi:hypothetical protein
MSHNYEDLNTSWRSVVRRRSFLAGLSVTGAALSAGKLIARDNDKLPKGDVAIIKFLAAAELVESDFWQQYNELGGVNGGNSAYKLALQNLDSDMPQYISDNTDDEMSHAAFLNAYLVSKGETPINLDAFRTLSFRRRLRLPGELTYAAGKSALHCVLPDASAIRETTLIVTRSQRSPRNWNAFEPVAPARS